MDLPEYREFDALVRFADKYVKVMTSLERQRMGQRAAPVRLVEAIGSQGEDDGVCADGPGETRMSGPIPPWMDLSKCNKPRSLRSRAPRALHQLAATQVGVLCVGQVAVDKELCKTEGLRGRFLPEAGLA